MIQSILKLVILTLVFPAQATFVQPADYEDAWELLNEAVSSIVERSEPRSNEEIREVTLFISQTKRSSKTMASKWP